MAMDNLNEDDKLQASTLPQRNAEQGCNLLTNDSANIDGVGSDCRHNDNVPSVSRSHNREIVPSGRNSSQINNPSNFHMHHYLHEGDHQSLLHRPNSGFLYQHAPFNLNSSERIDSGRKAAIVGNGSGGRPQGLKPIAKSMDGNISQPPLGLNFGMPMFSPNQGAVSLNSPENLEERHTTSNSRSNSNAGINTKLFGINLAGESKRGIVPPFSTDHSKMDSRRFLHPDFDMNGAFSGSQNNNEAIYDLPQNADAWMHSTDNYNRRPGVRLGPPSLPSDSNQIMQCDIKQTEASECTVFSSPGMVSNLPLSGQPPEFNCRPGVRLGPPSLPSDSNQIIKCDNKQSTATERTFFSSPGMASNQPLSGQLPEFKVNSTGKFPLQSSTSPLGVAIGRTSGMDPSNLGMQTGMRNMIAQVSRPSVRSSLKRGASEPQSSLVQARQRKALMNHPVIPPSVPTWTGSAPLMPNTTQTIFRSSHKAIPLTPQATGSTVHLPISTWVNTALPAPNTSQTIPPLIRAAPCLPAQACAAIPPPHCDKRIPSVPSRSQIISRPRQQLSRSLPCPHQPPMTRSLPRLRGRPPPIMPSPPRVVPPTPRVLPSSFIKLKGGADEPPGPLGYQCRLCKRDLSFAPEGPISQPFPPPVSAVLPCGHTFHNDCLEKITPQDQAKDPPCIPCALGD